MFKIPLLDTCYGTGWGYLGIHSPWVHWKTYIWCCWVSAKLLSCILIKCTFQSDLFKTLLCLQVNCFNSLGCTYRHILVDWSSSIFFPEWSLHKVGWCLGYLLIFHSLSTYAADENNPINLLIYVPGLLGTAAFAFFCFYLLIAVIAGEMMLGLKLVFITIHPMK